MLDAARNERTRAFRIHRATLCSAAPMLPAETVIAGKYRVLGTLGQGGMAVVYKAEHIEVGLLVAIKVMHRDFSRHPPFLERFRREARAAATIGHDNVAKVLDSGVHEEQPYMVIELLSGESLASRLEREPVLPVETACKIVGQMLMALKAAAGAGIVHRDLKPENVFLTQRGSEDDYVKLLDFGISKFGVGAEPGAGATSTRPGSLLGTPDYMAPEQAKAQPDVDARADVYSAGVMLYEMLTGERPFAAPSEAEIIAMICYRPHEPRPPSEMNPAVTPELEQVIIRAMRHKAVDRFATAAEMLDAIRPFAEEALTPRASRTAKYAALNAPRTSDTPIAWSGGPTTSPRRGSLETLAERGQPRARRPVVAIAGALVLVGVATLAFVSLRGRQDASHASAVPAVVRVQLAGLPDGAHASVDGRAISGSIMLLTRGARHDVRVEVPGRAAFVTSVVPEQPTTIQVVIPEPPVAPPVAPVVAQVVPVAPPLASPPTQVTAPTAPAVAAPSAHDRRPGRAASAPGSRAGGAPVHTSGSFVSGTAEY